MAKKNVWYRVEVAVLREFCGIYYFGAFGSIDRNECLQYIDDWKLLTRSADPVLFRLTGGRRKPVNERWEPELEPEVQDVATVEGPAEEVIETAPVKVEAPVVAMLAPMPVEIIVSAETLMPPIVAIVERPVVMAPPPVKRTRKKKAS